MSLFCGTCRLLFLGRNSVKYNRLHHQRILSLGLASLCRVAKKKHLLVHTSVLPVNKSKVGMFSPSIGMLSPSLSSLFSTVAEPAVDDEKVFVGGYNFNHDRKYLQDLFKQFGDIHGISFPFESTYNTSVCKPNEFRYGFIRFKNVDGARRAVQAASITGPDDRIIEIRNAKKKQKVDMPTYVVRGLPENITIHQLNDHFQQFGDVESIQISKTGSAFVAYKEGSDIICLPDPDHYLAGKMVEVRKVTNPKRQNRNVCKLIKITGITEDMTEEDIHNHFNAIGSIFDVKLSTDRSRIRSGVVFFHNKEDAISASNLSTHKIGTSHIKVQLVAISNE